MFFTSQSTFIWLGRLIISPSLTKKTGRGNGSPEPHYLVMEVRARGRLPLRDGAAASPRASRRIYALFFVQRGLKFTDVRAIINLLYDLKKSDGAIALSLPAICKCAFFAPHSVIFGWRFLTLRPDGLIVFPKRLRQTLSTKRLAQTAKRRPPSAKRLALHGLDGAGFVSRGKGSARLGHPQGPRQAPNAPRFMPLRAVALAFSAAEKAFFAPARALRASAMALSAAFSSVAFSSSAFAKALAAATTSGALRRPSPLWARAFEYPIRASQSASIAPAAL
jgi:hypothetical protein